MSILFGFDLLHPLPAYNAVVAVLFTLAAFWIDFFMQLIFGSIIFEKMESYNILRVLQTSIRVLSGSIIPLTFYPGIVRAVLKYLPFQFLGYIPGAILAGTVTGGEYQTLFLSALLWLFVLGGASFFFYRHFIRRIAVMGG
jgi:ABC-2 type transport system permease protein